jgi:uncharacterized coiled-coil protein SlyX
MEETTQEVKKDELTTIQKLTEQLTGNEQYLEKMKAEMYATLGRIAALKETIDLLTKEGK